MKLTIAEKTGRRAGTWYDETNYSRKERKGELGLGVMKLTIAEKKEKESWDLV